MVEPPDAHTGSDLAGRREGDVPGVHEARLDDVGRQGRGGREGARWEEGGDKEERGGNGEGGQAPSHREPPVRGQPSLPKSATTAPVRAGTREPGQFIWMTAR